MIRTGSIGIDIALGGGWRPGTMNEILGRLRQLGKTVLALHTVESVTRAGHNTLWIDTVDGVAHMDNAPRVIVARPRNAEQAFRMADMACLEEPSISLVVIDSSERLVRRRELAGDPTFVPHPQREYKDELTHLRANARASGTTVLFVGQPRDKEREPVRGTGISEKVAYRVHLHPDVVHQDGSREIQATVKDVASKTVTHDAARFTIRPGQGIDRARGAGHRRHRRRPWSSSSVPGWSGTTTGCTASAQWLRPVCGGNSRRCTTWRMKSGQEPE